MRKIFLSIIVVAGLFSCEKDHREIHDVIKIPVKDTIAQGTFLDTDDHHLSGKVALYKDQNGNKIIRLENFSVENGPDVYAYLSKSNTYENAQNVIKLGHFDGHDGQLVTGTVVYDIDDNIDTSVYKYVLLWCQKYSVRFGYAALK